jgi:hypothetical protein
MTLVGDTNASVGETWQRQSAGKQESNGKMARDWITRSLALITCLLCTGDAPLLVVVGVLQSQTQSSISIGRKRNLNQSQSISSLIIKVKTNKRAFESEDAYGG